MTQVTINIPDDELDFFLNLMKKFNYSASENQFALTSEIKRILDERLNEDTETYIPNEELIADINKRYGL